MDQYGTEALAGVDTTIPNAARIYDYLLGGKDNFEADRAAAETIMRLMPEAVRLAQANREFLGRAVRFCTDAGIRQFLDLGSGLPTQDNVHQVAQRADPDCRVVYVDRDPMVVRHGQALLQGPGIAVVAADVRNPQEILAHDEVRDLLDVSQPIAVLAVAIMHFIADEDDPVGVLSQFARVMAPGSLLVVTHTCPDLMDPETFSAAQEVYNRGSTPMHPRSKTQVSRLFSGFELVDPGLVEVSQWRPVGPVTPPPDAQIIGGIGRKPRP